MCARSLHTISGVSMCARSMHISGFSMCARSVHISGFSMCARSLHTRQHAFRLSYGHGGKTSGDANMHARKIELHSGLYLCVCVCVCVCIRMV